MSSSGTHIINKQIIEVHLSKETESYEIQQAVGTLFKEQLEPILSALLDKKFGNTTQHYQIEKLSIDLGEVRLDKIPEKFYKNLEKNLSKISPASKVKEAHKKEETVLEERTPYDILSYYLVHGSMPWWGDNSKAVLADVLDICLADPTPDFKRLLLQLQEQPSYLQRYVHTFSVTQLQKSMALLTGIETVRISQLSEEVKAMLGPQPTDTRFEKQFYTDFFNQYAATNDITILKDTLAKSIGLELGIDTIVINTAKVQEELLGIRSLLKKHKNKHPDHATWQHLCKRISHAVYKASAHKMPLNIVSELRQLLQRATIEEQLSETTGVPLTNHLRLFEKIAGQITPKNGSGLDSTSKFEDTDFITIENAGLVLFWPFLPRFFENLNVVKDKKFVDEAARHKAVCAMQYLCNPNESELFEGQLSLPKLLCGVALDEPVPPILLTEEEKEIARGLLNAVLKQGPHWKNLSIQGFRTSYINRQASLRTRDDHWLLQVQKETYDITLQKLPWSIQAVKLPWMQRALMVEWL